MSDRGHQHPTTIPMWEAITMSILLILLMCGFYALALS